MPSLLLMDDDVNHRRVIQHVLGKLYPELEVTEYFKPVSDDPGQVPNIQAYDLVLMDTTVGGQNSMGWMMAVLKHHEDAPAFIVLSSIEEPTPIIMQQMVIAIKSGLINFYFKKKLDMKLLMKDISGVLERPVDSGPDAEVGASPAQDDEEELTIKERLERKAMAEAALALDSLQGYKQWPFSLDAILRGNASLGRYKIVAFLGEDNTASTFKAELPNIKAPIALKIINRLRVGKKAIPESFIERYKAIAQNRHPNIIRLLHHEVIEERMVVAMEFLHGGTLEDKLKAAPLDTNMAIRYFRQLLEAMSMLHGLGIELHQIVPRQLMFRDENTLVLTQIGLINQLHALSEIAGEWPLPFSTPIYTTPESVQKRPTDLRSDIYLAGLIGYEMMAGKPMFASGSDQDVLYAHIMEPMPSLPDRGHPMNAIFAAMVDKSPDKRPQSPKVILEQLSKAGLA